MQRYAEHTPTCFDSHIEIEDREHWIVAPDICRSLENYPLLDEEDYFRREWEDATESWDSYGYRDFREQLTAHLETLHATREGRRNRRIPEAIEKLDDISSGDMWESFRDCVSSTIEFFTGSSGICFRFRFASDLHHKWNLIEIIESIEV